MDERTNDELIEDALELLARVPDELLALALRQHPVIQRIVALEAKNSVAVGRNASNGWSFEVKGYGGDNFGELQARVTALASGLDIAYPATPKK